MRPVPLGSRGLLLLLAGSGGLGGGAPALLLVGRADGDETALVAGDGALDQDEVVLSVDADHAEVADGDALGPVAAGHALALLGAAAAAVAGVRADAARGAVVLLDAVAGRQAGEAVPLHGAAGAATF